MVSLIKARGVEILTPHRDTDGPLGGATERSTGQENTCPYLACALIGSLRGNHLGEGEGRGQGAGSRRGDRVGHSAVAGCS